MKIIFTTKRYLPYIGGVEIYIQSIAKKLHNDGHEVTIITADINISKILFEQIDDMRVIRLPCSSLAGIYIPKHKKDLNVLDKEISKADVIHINDCKFLYRYFAKRKIRYGYKLIISSHGWLFHTKNHQKIKEIYFNHIVKRYAPMFDEIICVSSQDKNIAERYGINNVKMILNGADINKYSNLDPKATFDYNFFYWGRISKNKGIYECLKKLATLECHYLFKIAGVCENVEYMEKLKIFIDKYNMYDKISFLGLISDEEIRNHINEADVILMPSLYEGFGLTLVESLLSGRIIIANRIESYEYILKEVGAEEFLFDYQDENASFMRKINELRENKTVPHSVDVFSTERMIDHTISCYM